MNLLKELAAFLAIIALSACASAPKATYLNNELIPGKTYSLQSTALPIASTTLFYAVVPVKDLDGKVNTIAYLPINENLNFVRTEIEGLYSRVSVTNPTKAAYSVKYNVATTYSDGTVEGRIFTVGVSELDQRTFTVSIPIPPKMIKASLYVYLVDDKGQELMRIGDFRYAMTFPHVSTADRKVGE